MTDIPILYVDDDENDVLLLKHAIRSAQLPFRLITVSDPDTALAYLAGQGAFEDRLEHPFPAFILLDLILPRMHGFEILAWIRAQAGFRRMVVIILTASTQADQINRAYELGANSYLVKPVDLASLVEIVTSLNSYWVGINQRPAVATISARAG